MNSLENLFDSVKLAPAVWRHESEFDPTLPEYAGIQAITYDALTVEGQKTQSFAYIGFPESAKKDEDSGESAKTVPGIVLVHGGGGHAYLEWVRMWNARGYAAIAMDTVGFFPTVVNAGITEGDSSLYKHGLHGPFAREGYIITPNNDGFTSSDRPLTEQWMTHAVSQVIAANNVLRSFDCVDNDRIGLTGISWGGEIASIVIGYDQRFAFAIPVYGAGFLSKSLTVLGERMRNPVTAALWQAEDRFDQVHMPIFWICYNDDNHFSIMSNSDSYAATASSNERTILSMVDNMGHSHVDGWRPLSIMNYADWIVRDGRGFVRFLTQPTVENPQAIVRVPEGANIISTTLYYIDAPMTYSVHDKFNRGASYTYMDQVWQRGPASISDSIEGNTTIGEQLAQNRVISTVLPPEAHGFYLEIVTEEGISTSQWVTR